MTTYIHVHVYVTWREGDKERWEERKKRGREERREWGEGGRERGIMGIYWPSVYS